MLWGYTPYQLYPSFCSKACIFTLNKVNTNNKQFHVNSGKGFTAELIQINYISLLNELRKGCPFL